jgi:non-ribosomal peptide synthetase component F
MSEAAHQMTSNPLPEDGERFPGSVGRGVGVEISIRAEDGKALEIGKKGEICIVSRSLSRSVAEPRQWPARCEDRLKHQKADCSYFPFMAE